MLFSAPEFGWCRISVGDWTVSGSYLADYPYTIPEALITAYDAYDAAEIGDVLSSFSIDGEDTGVFTVKIGKGAVEVWEFDGDFDAGDRIVYSISCDKSNLAEMALDAADDLLTWLMEWSAFWTAIDENKDGRFTEEGMSEARRRAVDFISEAIELTSRALKEPTRQVAI